MRIEEKTLILPTLYIINENGPTSTSELIHKLTIVFKPIGEDAQILAGRNDTKFSQKVRNLKSHRSINGMAELTEYRNGKYTLTDDGQKYLEVNKEAIEYLFNNNFDYDEVQKVVGAIEETKNKKKKVVVYIEDEKIAEGKTTKTETSIKKRSKRLRDAAISKYTRADGRIVCHACGFDFEEKYGEYGKGYIQMHHEHPLYQYSDEGFESYISEAVEKIKPLCSNCHSIIHRNVKKTLSVDELKNVIK